MNAIAHSPGPWKVSREDSDDPKHRAAINSPGWFAFAEVVVQMEDDPNPSPAGMANARLIAAAPRMLAILQDVAKTINDPEADDYFDANRIESNIATVMREIAGEAGAEWIDAPERHRQIWLVQVDVPPREGHERKGWRHSFYVAAFDADEAIEAVKNGGGYWTSEPGYVVHTALPLAGVIGGGSVRLQQWPHK